ncbi:DUF4397 domain-containing protein [Chitinophaga filiformis]|uniref:DUF4397 domain-containing protein n=1 Tax=Chitinophaga filiformis TaxID=104663 RepID=A0ABY4HWM6_CHIFI|nr:DUF4397 domain-containing protein [Chitinophaga filiformis]UPK68005.1 DUF4397 domain-containing protein [Chitinophaga filiformis]
MNTNTFILLVILCVAFLSCNKEDADITGAPAAITLVNSVAGSGSDLTMNFSGQNINYIDSKRLTYNANDGKQNNGSLTFGVPVNLPIPLIVTLVKDTTKPIFSQSITFQPGDIYSLFFGGKPESVSYVLVKDTLPEIKDSLTAIRFINMSQDLKTVSINLVGQPNGSEVSSLNYMQITGFKTYPAKSTNSSYIFEVRDFATGNFLARYNYNNIARQKHITLIVRGLKPGSPGPSMVRMNNW